MGLGCPTRVVEGFVLFWVWGLGGFRVRGLGFLGVRVFKASGL